MGRKNNKRRDAKPKNATTGAVGKLDVTRSGMGYVIVENQEKDILVRPQDFNQALHGDKVRVKVMKHNVRSGRMEGVVTEVVERKQTEFIGRLELNADFGFFIPDKAKGTPDMYIGADKLNGVARLCGIMVVYFTCIAIVIACLGLFGLAAFSAEQRTKEIGIRKVLGASVANVTTMLSKDFLKLVFIAILVASPISWLIMNRWLQDFAYQTKINWWLFPLTGIVAILIAVFTISFQSIKAALANPVKSLKTD